MYETVWGVRDKRGWRPGWLDEAMLTSRPGQTPWLPADVGLRAAGDYSACVSLQNTKQTKNYKLEAGIFDHGDRTLPLF